MTDMRYPISRAVRLSRSAKRLVRRRHPNLVGGSEHMGESAMLSFCSENAIIVFSDDLTGTKAGVAMSVQGTPCIVLDHSKLEDPCDRPFVLAHELSHVVLGHLNSTNFAVMGFSETVRKKDLLLQKAYFMEQELSADLLALMILLPDGFLDRQLVNWQYIRTKAIAEELHLSVDLVAARVQLYRMTFPRRRQQHEDKLSLGQQRYGKSIEMAGTGGLIPFLPDVDRRILKIL